MDPQLNVKTSMFRALCLLAAFLACACEPPSSQEKGGTPEGASGKAGGKLLGVSVQTMTNPFFVDLTGGLQEVIEAHGDKLLVLDAQFDSLRQGNDISDLILRGVSALFINPVNWESIKGSLLQAKAKGIPVIVVDAPVKDESLVLSTVASDNVEAGRLAARALSKAVSPLNVAILGYSVNKACIDRVAGFKEVLQTLEGARHVEAELTKGSAESARPLMQDLMGRHQDLNAVFAINDPSAMGVISAFESAGKLSSVKIAAVDGAQEAVQAILGGKLLSSSAQFPREIGKRSAEVAYDHFAGKAVEKEVKVRVELITKDNAAAFLKKN